MITRLTRAGRMAGVACLIAAAASLVGGSSGAGADTFRVAGSWYWANQPPPAPPPVGQPLGNVQPPDVPATDVATAVQNGASEKEAYLHIDTTAVPPGSTVSDFVLTLTEDATAPGNAAEATAAVKAFPATAFFPDGANARPYAERPPYDDKGSSAVGKRVTGTGGGQGAGVQWTFDLTSIVNSWLSAGSQNNGIALVGDASQSQNFEVVWSGPTADPSVSHPPTAQGTVAPGGSGGAPPVPVEATPPATGAPSSGSGASPSVTVPVSTSGPGVPTIDQPLAPPANHTGGLPSVAVAPARLHRAGAHRAPPAEFWLAGVGVIVLGLACMAALGPAGEPSTRRRGSVLRALERRAGQGGVPAMGDAMSEGAPS